MKSTIFLFSIFLLVSCQKNNKYVLNGSFSGEQNEDYIYIVKLPGDYANRDSAKIENGKFKFEGTIDTPEIYAVHYRMDKIIGIASFFLEPGNLDLKINLKNWDLNTKATGSKINDEFNQFEAERIKQFMQRIWELNQQVQTASPEDIEFIKDSIKNLSIANDKYELDYIKNHYNSPIALYLFYRGQEGLSTNQVGEIISNIHPSLHNSFIYKTILADYENKMQQKKQAESLEISEGTKIHDAIIKDTHLLELIVKQNPDKVLYIDIWATWCAPCKKEFPFSKKLYQKIDSSQIEMIFLCVNSKKDEWEQMIKLEGLKGKHFLIDNDSMDQFENENGLDIQGIPRYIIVGKDGIIKYKDAPRPSSEELEKLLTQLAE